MKPSRFTEDQLLYLCCRQDFTDEYTARVLSLSQEKTVNWQTLFTLAHNHGVAPLVFRNLQIAMAQGLDVPQETVDRFRLAMYRNIKVKTRQANTLADAVSSLRRLDVDVMVVKGMALDLLVYDEAWYTVAQDTDIIMRPAEDSISDADMAAILACVEGRGIEYEFKTHHDVSLNSALNIDFEQIWCDAQTSDLAGNTLYLMCPEDMLLATCINSCRKRYFRLRSLCDIAETIQRCTELDWSDFVRKAKQYGCNHIAYSALTVTQHTVGCPLPDGILNELGLVGAKRRVVDRLIPFLLQRVSLGSLSYYTGQEIVGRKVGWSLLLPYVTYQGSQMSSKLSEALSAYFGRGDAIPTVPEDGAVR